MLLAGFVALLDVIIVDVALAQVQWDLDACCVICFEIISRSAVLKRPLVGSLFYLQLWQKGKSLDKIFGGWQQ